MKTPKTHLDTDNPVTVDLTQHRGKDTTLYTGRPEGKRVRVALNLDSLDESKSQINVIVPDGTTSIKSSFFLGLFYKSILKLGLDGFILKYKFIFETGNEDSKLRLQANLARNLNYAKNSLNTDEDAN